MILMLSSGLGASSRGFTCTSSLICGCISIFFSVWTGTITNSFTAFPMLFKRLKTPFRSLASSETKERLVKRVAEMRKRAAIAILLPTGPKTLKNSSVKMLPTMPPPFFSIPYSKATMVFSLKFSQRVAPSLNITNCPSADSICIRLIREKYSKNSGRALFSIPDGFILSIYIIPASIINAGIP